MPVDSPTALPQLDDLRDRQRSAWQRGERLLVDVLVAGIAPPLADSEMLEMIYSEVMLRTECGETCQVDEYVQRFPQLAESLQRLFAVHQALEVSGAKQPNAEVTVVPGASTGEPHADITLIQSVMPTTVSGPGLPTSSGPMVGPDVVAVHGNGAFVTSRTISVTPVTGPRRIGRYRLVGVLGEGAFGRVYLGMDDELQRPVAIKVPKPERFRRPEDAEDYLAEARTVASLDHPHIVPVYDVGRTDDGSIYVVSKFIEGCTLADKLSEERPTHKAATILLATIAQALYHAHQNRLIHRDVKPANILLEEATDKAYIADFGLAIREEDYLQEGQLAGTPAYMSPEQARGEGHRLDGRSDIFSLGVVLYELLTGRKPFRGRTANELLHQVVSVEPAPPRELEHSLPLELERICLKALSKRTSDRYSTADELADDLLHWQQGPQPEHRELQIVPKGLRSFDAGDSDFFLDLLPGPRDRDGLPESLRFWKTRMEETDPEKTFSVGLIYGPSGCGKSSLVKAGLLPRLSKNVSAIYIEATPDDTETRILCGLRKQLPDLPDHLGLVGTCKLLRRSAGRKIVIVLDQFEQWLHAHRAEQETELVSALRQCDGERLQAVVMVRDDFGMAATRFMNSLDIPIVQGDNFATVDLFDVDHAQKVLIKFGQAFSKVPAQPSQLSEQEREFVSAVANGLARDGQVVSVRLALFAEMVKGKPWVPATLAEVGGTEGIGVNFLEETFASRSANPSHRLHQSAARNVLKALLPEAGTDIKGHMRSHSELMEAAGYQQHPGDFQKLLRILDGELRLITPTDPEGVQTASGSDVSSRFYQLTHDYLVPSLRDWLTLKQKETRRGRAELLLADRASVWNARPENRQLPSLWQWFQIQWLTARKNWTPSQRKMMAKAGRVHAIRWGITLAVLLAIGLAIWNVVATERQSSLRRQLATAVDAVQSNRSVAVPLTLRELGRLPREMVLAELKARYANAEPQNKLGLAYALADYGDVDLEYLGSQIQHAAPEEVENLSAAFRQTRDASLEALHSPAKRAEAEKNWRYKTRLAIVSLHLEDDRLAADMCRIDQRPDLVQRTIFIDEFPTWSGDISGLATYCRTRSDPALRSGLCLGVGGIPASRLTDPEKAAWKPVLAGWYATALDTGTHSASGWVLRQWGSDLPTLSAAKEPQAGHNWFVNSLGLTLLKIEPGKLVRKDETPGAKEQTVKLTRPFYLSDREISVGQFQQFVNDATYPTGEKPANWKGADAAISPTPDHPVQNVSWYDSVLFCNWLSLKEGRTACYERTGKKEKDVRGNEQDIWRLVPHGTGYRLPTEAEWDYACRAGTTTDYASGSDAELLRKYAVFQCSRAEPGGKKLPNGWGLFDMPGNVWEWCECDDSVGSDRVVRGGCWGGDESFCRSAARFTYPPIYRINGLMGFRPALSSVQSVK